jgi:hypothetical protein
MKFKSTYKFKLLTWRFLVFSILVAVPGQLLLLAFRFFGVEAVQMYGYIELFSPLILVATACALHFLPAAFFSIQWLVRQHRKKRLAARLETLMHQRKAWPAGSKRHRELTEKIRKTRTAIINNSYG